MGDMIKIGQGIDLKAMVPGDIITSLDRSTPEGKRMIFQAMGSAVEKVDENIDEVISVKDVLYHRVEVESQVDGAIIQATRTVLITPEGEMYAALSSTLPTDVLHLAALFGPPPWNPPIKIKFGESKSKRGRRFFALTIVPEENEDAKGKGKSGK